MVSIDTKIAISIRCGKIPLFGFAAARNQFAALVIERRLAAFPQRPVKVFGLTFPNPVGLAAGFDKNGDYLAPLKDWCFGFIEVGAATPKPANR